VKIEVLECENKKSILKNSLVVKKEHTLNEIKTIEKELSTEEKKKHEYEVEKKRINNEICFHKGNKDKHNTKIYFEEELKYIKIALIPELKKLIDKRKELTKDIYEEKKSIVSLYQ